MSLCAHELLKMELAARPARLVLLCVHCRLYVAAQFFLAQSSDEKHAAAGWPHVLLLGEPEHQ